VCSDRAAAGVYTDRGGPVVKKYLEEKVQSEYDLLFDVIPDAQKGIEEKLVDWCDNEKCALILTTGGTGPAEGDCAPEATAAIVAKIMPGFGEAMRMTTLPKVPTTILSRATAGVRGFTLILNLPGSPKAIPECLDPVLQAIPHVVRIRGGPTILLRDTATTKTKDPNQHHHSNDDGCDCGGKH